MRVSSAAPAVSFIAPAGREIAGRGFATATSVRDRAGEPALAPAATASAIGRSRVAAALAQLADSQRNIDGLIDAAARGRTFTPAQLLALQAIVSRDAQAVEVVSRVADRVVGAVKQTLGTQI